MRIGITGAHVRAATKCRFCSHRVSPPGCLLVFFAFFPWLSYLAVMSQETSEPIAVRLLQSVCSFGDLLNHYPVGHSVPSCRSCTPTTTILTQFMQKTDNATIRALSPLRLCIRSLKENCSCGSSLLLLLIFAINIFRHSWSCVRKRVRTAAVFPTFKCGGGPALLSNHNIWTSGSGWRCWQDSLRRRA